MAVSSRAVVASAYGGPEVLRVVDVDTAEPGPGNVLIDVKAAAVNAIDWKRYSGAERPTRPGCRCGSVRGLGRRQRGRSLGALAVPGRRGHRLAGRRRVRRPDRRLRAGDRAPAANLDWAPASGLLLTGATAVHTLSATGTHDADVVLVHGGSGGVGRMVVQLAVLRGAQVIATASPRQHDDLRALGALPVAYGDGLLDRLHEVVRCTGPITVAIDTVGTDEALDASVAVVADRQRIATIAGFRRAGELGIRALGGGPGADPGTLVREAARAQLAELAADGSLDVRVAQTYALEDAAKAHAEGLTGHANGKLVLVP